MSPALQAHLRAIDRTLRIGRMERRLLGGLAAAGLLWFASALADMLFRAGPYGRWSAGLLLLAVATGTAVLGVFAFRRRRTPEALAAAIEHAFPELDNRLINYLQFARDAAGDPFKSAYVGQGPPELGGLDLDRMRDAGMHRRLRVLAAAAVLLLLAPLPFWGGHWTRALARMAHPLADLAPRTHTRIETVDPGDAEVRQGEPVLLVCSVRGAARHAVRLDIEPDDARRVTYDLGPIEGSGIETFSHRVPRVATGFRYRFRAGDSPPSAWHRIAPRLPPAFTRIELEMTPPAYTGLPGLRVDALGGPVPAVPDGTTVRVEASLSAPVERLSIGLPGAPAVSMTWDRDAMAWRGSLSLAPAEMLHIEGVDAFGEAVRESIALAVVRDQPPRIDVIAPQGRVVLPPGEAPRIEFRVSDDYGLASVHIAEWEPGMPEDAPGRIHQAWDASGEVHLHRVWQGEPGRRPASATFRIVASDGAPEGPHLARSDPIVFHAPPPGEVQQARDRFEEEARAGLAQVIVLQRRNLEQTRELQTTGAAGEGWREAEGRQREIRSLTRDLLHNPVRPLGGRTEDMAGLYGNEMVHAIDTLALLPGQDTAAHTHQAAEALRLQSLILRRLNAAETAAGKASVDRRLSGISALLAALVQGQTRILGQAEALAESGAQVASALFEAQDALAEDVGALETTCTQDAQAVRGSDEALADLLEDLAREAAGRRIRDDMLLAAERLELHEAAEALPLGGRALANLEYLRDRLDQVGLRRDQEQREAMVEALAQARQTAERIEAIHQTVQDAMDGIRGHADKGDERFDLLAEEYVELVRRNRESLLTIPVDLHVFTDLNVANELVEDVYSIFQEVEQVEGSEDLPAEEVIEIAYAKNLDLLELMREMTDRFDDIEMWLGDEPDQERVVTETLDREEMPPGGIALGALSAQLEDLISDVLLESAENRDAAHDGATTHAVPDWWDSGHQVMEGDISSFGAQGKSGNQVPDHKEQDGRSNVGREGMSVGETAAGAGVIEAGDEHIQERRTEDPTQAGMVQLEGEADTAATGGGRLASGKADEHGMGGGVRRMDSAEQGSWEGMAALLARRADALFVQASLQNVRVDSLRTAAHHLRQADDAIARGEIARIEEYRRRAAGALEHARAQLAVGPSGALDIEAMPRILQDAVQAGSDLAPPRYRQMVAEYYRLLNEAF